MSPTYSLLQNLSSLIARSTLRQPIDQRLTPAQNPMVGGRVLMPTRELIEFLRQRNLFA